MTYSPYKGPLFVETEKLVLFSNETEWNASNGSAGFGTLRAVPFSVWLQ